MSAKTMGEVPPQFVRTMMMIGVYKALPAEELGALHKWESENLGELATSDWPGWDKYLGRAPKPPALDVRAGRPLNSEKRPRKTACKIIGIVYVLKSSGGIYKIGKTVDFKQRMLAYNTHSPERLEVIHLFRTDDIHDLEQEFHRKFSSRRMHGEWFRLQPEDLSYLSEFKAVCDE